MPTIISIDPGHSTGVVAQRDGTTILAATLPDSLVLAGTIDLWFADLKPSTVIMERMPIKSVDERTKKVFYHISELCTQLNVPLVQVAPGIWKPVTPKAVTNPLAVHTNDALKLMFYVANINPDLLPKGKKNES